MPERLIYPLGTADIATRAGVYAAIASVGPSFDRGLMPRNTIDQAAVTGIMAAINYGLTATAQSGVESSARWVAQRAGAFRSRRGGDPSTENLTRAGILVADLVGIGVGAATARLLAERPHESTARAVARFAAARVTWGSIAGAVTVTTLATADRIDPSGGLSRAPVVAAAGVVTTAGLYSHNRWKARRLRTPEETSDTGRDPLTIRAGRTIATGAAVSGTLIALAVAERSVSSAVAGLIRRARPDAALIARPIGHAVALGGLGLGLYQVGKRLYESADEAGNAIEAAYQTPPSNPLVSGAPGSLVDWEDIGREGRRFVNMALTGADITRVVGEPAVDPIRAFVGLDSAPNEIERADLAMQELERLQAFDRPYVAIFSPTGTGYVNYVATEALEYYTRGNVASVCVQYSFRPSGLSLDRVDEGRRQIMHLTNALAWRLRGIPEERRPRVLLFGESLGSWAALDAFMKEGVSGLGRAGIDAALFVGTPGPTTWSREWRQDPTGFDPGRKVVEVDSYEEWLAHDEDLRRSSAVMLLSHHNDPVVKLEPDVALRRPAWMGDPLTREPGVPREVNWRPIYGFVSLLFDFKNSMAVKPGHFVRFGHDYRTDLGRIVPAAFDLPPMSDEQHDAVEAALRTREAEWAVLREGADRLAEAERTFRERLEKMGISADSLPPLVSAPDFASGAQDYDRESLREAVHQASLAGLSTEERSKVASPADPEAEAAAARPSPAGVTGLG